MLSQYPLILLFFCCLLNLVITVTAKDYHGTSQAFADSVLDILNADHPNIFGGVEDSAFVDPKNPPKLRRSRERNSSPRFPSANPTAHLASRDTPNELGILIPGDARRRYITIFVRIGADLILQDQMYNAMNAVGAWATRRIEMTGDPNTVIPGNLFPMIDAPPSANRAYMQIDEGPDGGMRLQTLLLAMEGVYSMLYKAGKFFEATFEIWDEYQRHVGNGLLALNP